MLDQEQVERLKAISQLPGEKQQEAFNEFLGELTPEQIEFLKNQQKCMLCSVANNEVRSEIVYQDEDYTALLDINPANNGHTIILPRKHRQFYWELENSIHDVVSKLSTAIIQAVKAEGLNIFVANGAVAGQNSPHIVVHLIPRFKDDGIKFSWNARKTNEADLTKIAGFIVNNLSDKRKGMQQDLPEKQVAEEPGEEHIDYSDFGERIP